MRVQTIILIVGVVLCRVGGGRGEGAARSGVEDGIVGGTGVGNVIVSGTGVEHEILSGTDVEHGTMRGTSVENETVRGILGENIKVSGAGVENGKVSETSVENGKVDVTVENETVVDIGVDNGTSGRVEHETIRGTGVGSGPSGEFVTGEQNETAGVENETSEYVKASMDNEISEMWHTSVENRAVENRVSEVSGSGINQHTYNVAQRSNDTVPEVSQNKRKQCPELEGLIRLSRTALADLQTLLDFGRGTGNSWDGGREEGRYRTRRDRGYRTSREHEYRGRGEMRNRASKTDAYSARGGERGYRNGGEGAYRSRRDEVYITRTEDTNNAIRPNDGHRIRGIDRGTLDLNLPRRVGQLINKFHRRLVRLSEQMERREERRERRMEGRRWRHKKRSEKLLSNDQVVRRTGDRIKTNDQSEFLQHGGHINDVDYEIRYGNNERIVSTNHAEADRIAIINEAINNRIGGVYELEEENVWENRREQQVDGVEVDEGEEVDGEEVVEVDGTEVEEVEVEEAEEGVEVVVEVDTKEALREVPPTYLSLALSPRLIQEGWLHFNTSSSHLLTLVRALAPAVLRVGGSAANFLTYDPYTHSGTPSSTAQHSTLPQTAPQSSTTQQTTPQQTAPQSSTTQQTTPQQTAPQSSTTQQTTPQQTAPQSSTTQQTTPQQTAPQSSTTQQPTPQQTAPQSSTAQQTAPQSSTAQQTAPQSSTTQHSTPQQSTPSKFFTPQPSVAQTSPSGALVSPTDEGSEGERKEWNSSLHGEEGCCCDNQVAINYTNFTITSEDWMRLLSFCEDVGMTMLFDLNQFYRQEQDEEEEEEGVAIKGEWDPSNARLLVRDAAARGVTVAWQLGNEPNSYKHKFGKSISGKKAARDYEELQGMLKEEEEEEEKEEKDEESEDEDKDKEEDEEQEEQQHAHSSPHAHIHPTSLSHTLPHSHTNHHPTSPPHRHHHRHIHPYTHPYRHIHPHPNAQPHIHPRTTPKMYPLTHPYNHPHPPSQSHPHTTPHVPPHPTPQPHPHAHPYPHNHPYAHPHPQNHPRSPSTPTHPTPQPHTHNHPRAYPHSLSTPTHPHPKPQPLPRAHPHADPHPPHSPSTPTLPHPIIVGPDVTKPKRHHPGNKGAEEGSVGTESMDFLREFLTSARVNLSAITWHQYYINGHTAGWRDFLNPTIMDQLWWQVAQVAQLRDQLAPHLPIWLSETGSACGGGAGGLSDTFLAGFLWLDKLGVGAVAGVDLIARQTLYMASYALLDPHLRPNPDYWLSVVYKRLVGGRVLHLHPSTTTTPPPTLRLYTHCLNRHTHPDSQGGLVIFGMNVDERGSVKVKLGGGLASSPLLQYLLQSPLTSREVSLNGVKLEVGGDGSLPPLNPAPLPPGVVTVPPLSMGFWALPYARAPACL